MEFEVYIIYDARTNRYTAPMLFDNDATAVRDFVTEAMKPYTRTHEFPEDYTLYKIGIYNETDGMITQTHAKEKVCCLSDYIKKEFK